MELLEKEILSETEKREILHLWNSEYPVNLQYSTISHFEDYLKKMQDDFHLLVKLKNQTKGWYFDFLREDERWFGLILHSDLHGKGLGTDILNRIKAQRKELHGWIIPDDMYFKADGKPYKSPHKFYLKNDFYILPEIQLKTRKISAVKIEWKADFQ